MRQVYYYPKKEIGKMLTGIGVIAQIKNVPDKWIKFGIGFALHQLRCSGIKVTILNSPDVFSV